MKSQYLYILLIYLSLNGHAQLIRGTVTDSNHQSLIGATVLELSTQNGTITQIDGQFELSLLSESKQLIVSYLGFITDTVFINNEQVVQIMLAEDTESLEEVVVQSSPTFIDKLEATHFEVITEAELTKAACCNLSESFETNASVDVSFSDAVTGAKTINMLGLAGKYVQINRENVPHIRGLTNRYGLGFVPGTWIQSIDVGKGGGSVVNGFESMTGQINLEFKKPEIGEKWYLNGYVNSFGKVELNANHRYDLGKRWSSSLLIHTDYLNNEIDNNDDGFLDLPKSRQINVLNRYKYTSEKLVSQFGIHYMKDEKAGGQTGFGFQDDFNTSSEYGFSNHSDRIEVFGKTGILFPHKPYKGWGFIYSASFTDINSGYGRNNYLGEETTLYGNVIYQNIFDNSFHQYRTGISFLQDNFQEVFADSAFSRSESIPGAYFEYTYTPSDKFTLVAGLRYDIHNLFDDFFTQRLHLRYQLTPKTTLRSAIGKGYRTPNAIIENSNVLVSSRRLIIQEAPTPEIAWNMGGSIVSSLAIGNKDLSIVADYFFTDFQNQLIYDLDANANELNIYNLNGHSFAHSFQLELSYPISDLVKIKGAYKYYDVQATINGQLMEVPFNPRNRFFLNTSYATKYDKWTADATIQWIGSKRLPDTSTKDAAFQLANKSPDYALINLQISRGFRWGNIYLGSENLFDYQQNNPIIDPVNPFGDQFDASIIWGPIAGRLVYAGFRYKIK